MLANTSSAVKALGTDILTACKVIWPQSEPVGVMPGTAALIDSLVDSG